MIKECAEIKIYEIFDKKLVIYNWENLNENSTPVIWENVFLFSSSGEKIWQINGMKKIKGWKPSWSRGFKYAKNVSGEWKVVDLGGRVYNLNLKCGGVEYEGFTKL